MFFFCHIWKLIPTTYEVIQSVQEWNDQPFGNQANQGAVVTEWPEYMVFINDISHALLSTNSAANFLYYILL